MSNPTAMATTAAASSSSSALKWLSLIATIWLQTFNGPNADFPVYSSELKELKQISQVGINFLAFASDAGKLFALLSGLAAMHLPMWIVSAVGAALVLAGYGLQFLFLDNPHFSYSHIFLLTALAGNGICWINTACYLVCIENFSSHSRAAISLSTSYVGLSAKVYTVIATAVFRKWTTHKAKNYLLLNAVAPALVALLVAPLLRLIPSKVDRATKPNAGFVVMFAITFATGISAIIGSIGAARQGTLATKYALSLGVLITSPLVVPLAVKLREATRAAGWREKENRVHHITLDDADVEIGDGSVREVEVHEVALEMKSDAGEAEGGVEESENDSDVGGPRILKKIDFWLYFFSYLFSATLGLVFLNNLGQIAESRGLEPDETSTLVSLSSAAGFFGRLMPFLLDYYSSKRNCVISRAASMAALMAPMAGAFFALVKPSRLALYACTAVIGALTGAITSIAVSATTELFGAKHFSVNHNIVVTNIPLGSFVFGYVAALLYQRGLEEGSHRCRGGGCYEKSFLMWGGACSLGALLCAILYLRRSILYLRRSKLWKK